MVQPYPLVRRQCKARGEHMPELVQVPWRGHLHSDQGHSPRDCPARLPPAMVLTLVGTMVRLLEMYLENCTTWYKDLKYERRRRPQDEETGKEGGDEEDAKEEQKGSPKAGQAEERQAEARTGHKEPGVSSAGKEV
mmetsp:Transcript_6226/g.19326  ORF Transcript_6226/g.19326 Transcript_6226/m.19326 type:complete len:136 (-) Transcript_6226:33-440(-)